MTKRHKRIILVLLTLVFLAFSACSTIRSKSLPPTEVGHAYSGIRYSFNCTWPTLMKVSVPFPPALIITVPVLVIDSGFSLVTDTLLLPVDWSYEGTGRKEGCS